MNITIRLAALDDAEEMANILSRSWEVAYKNIIPAEVIKEKNATRLEMFKRLLAENNNMHYVILSEGNPVGIMTVGPPKQQIPPIKNDTGIDDSFWELHGLYLHPAYYRRGLGTKAMEFAVEQARAAGKTNLLLWVLENNENAIKFYEKCGFVHDGASIVLNLGKELLCLRMRKSLT